MFVSMPTKISHADGSQLAGLRKIRRESVGTLTYEEKFSSEARYFKFNNNYDTERLFVTVQR